MDALSFAPVVMPDGSRMTALLVKTVAFQLLGSPFVQI